MRVLSVKVSSLGDVIHTLPALTDAKRAIPEIEFDWAVEEAFTEIPSWHPSVNKVITVPFRQLKKKWLTALFSQEHKQLKNSLQEVSYDLIIDAQGLLKSAYISSLAKGKKGKVVGLDKASIREKIATRFYDDCYNVSKEKHAVERTRELFSKALGYSLISLEFDYGLDESRFVQNISEKKSMLFLHGTTWETKHWPEKYWCDLGKMADSHGYKVNLLWGNALELSRAKRISKSIPRSSVLDKLSLSEIATRLIQSEIVVSVDTGLAHLSAALNRPTISLYAASDPIKTGTYGKRQIHLNTPLSCSPCLKRKCHYKGEDLAENEKNLLFKESPPCFTELTPTVVWQNVMNFFIEANKEEA